MYSYRAEVCTHLCKVQVESCRKCELRKWRDVTGENLWFDSATGNSGSFFFLGGGLSLTKDHVVRIASRVNGLHPGWATLPSGRK